MKTLSIQRPRPSIEIDPGRRQCAGEGGTGELAALIGVEDLGLPQRASASSNASTQNAASIVLESRQASTARETQSMIATRYRKPRLIGI